MITDQKTQNRLHADTGMELFSIRQRKEAVTRMLDILKETPEHCSPSEKGRKPSQGCWTF